MRDGKLGVRVCVDAAHLQIGAFQQIRADGARRRIDPPLDDRHVDTIDGMGRELLLQPFTGMEGLGENEHSRGLAIETVHDVNALFPSCAEVSVQIGLGGVLPFAFGSHRQQAVAFQDHDHVNVLMQDRQARWEIAS